MAQDAPGDFYCVDGANGSANGRNGPSGPAGQPADPAAEKEGASGGNVVLSNIPTSTSRTATEQTTREVVTNGGVDVRGLRGGLPAHPSGRGGPSLRSPNRKWRVPRRLGRPPGSAGKQPPRGSQPVRRRILFWGDIFRHINSTRKARMQEPYPWTNADRKILANAARKYGSFEVLAMWDLFDRYPAQFARIAALSDVHSMVLNSRSLLEHHELKDLAAGHKTRLETAAGMKTPGETLAELGIEPKAF
jgi:hypothetical protein